MSITDLLALRYKTASKEKVINLLVDIPVTSTGEFDIEKQQEIATTYKKVEETKKLIQEELKKNSYNYIT